MGAKLDAGDAFPSITINLVGGGNLSLPADLETPYGVVLFYRGFW